MRGHSYISFINHTVFEVFCLTVVDKCKTVHFVVQGNCAMYVVGCPLTIKSTSFEIIEVG